MAEIMNAITRKAGDTIVIKGTLDGDNLPASAAWIGAIAKMNIASVDGTAAITDGAVTLDTGTRAFEYKGAALTAGSYHYEIKVTFTDGTILRWPNDGFAKLLVVKKVA